MQAHKRQKPFRQRLWKFMNKRAVVAVEAALVYGLVFGRTW